MTVLDSRILRPLFLASLVVLAAAFALVFSGVMPPFYKKKPDLSDFAPPSVDIRIAAFSDLAGWERDDPSAAFDAYLRSCAALMNRPPEVAANAQEYLGDRLKGLSLGGTVADWLPPCRAASEFDQRSYSSEDAWRRALRAFFESYFRPIQILNYYEPKPEIAGSGGRSFTAETGLFTGYYEPVFEAARTPTRIFNAPVYKRPGDLIDVDLGAFRQELSGQRVAGRVDGNQLVPYPDHQAINDGALAGAAQPIAWMKPNDLFFLQIQGSGRLRFDDEGEALRIGYAGQNGHPYTAIGRTMAQRQILPLEEISMQSIRAWLDQATPEEARELREQNASYVFFAELDTPADGLGPLGAQGVPLSPGRSLAVDRRYHMLGAPIWVDIEPVEAAGLAPIRRLMIAQDTGGAIKGPVRGDFFWGAGAEAGAVAGKMKASGSLYVLAPRTIADRLRPPRNR